MNRFQLVVIILISFLAGCASDTISGMLRFQDREILFHPEKACTLAYPHKEVVCKDRPRGLRWLGKKCRKVQKLDEYELTVDMQKKFISSGFTCKSKMRFQY